MRLATFRSPGDSAARAGEVRDGVVVAFADGVTVRELLGRGDLAPAEGQEWPLDAVTLLAPVPDPRAIYGIGLNYAPHAAETGRERPQFPIVFTKVPTAVAPPGGPVRCPPVVRCLDYEGELAVVIGPEARAAGYAVADDVSARDLQRREPQWTRAKGADTFCPYGPWITTADEVPDPHALRLRTWVNGEPRQDACTADLIFGVDELVAFLSETHSLRAGDLILTGTPSGVGMALDPPRFLGPGDVVRIEIDSLGAIEHAVKATGAPDAGSAAAP
jgi:2-keto-4-pentenoate hydratase/2-oxohepta-3-ene-1,7-dioic acid hydratase in catechol pathway